MKAKEVKKNAFMRDKGREYTMKMDKEERKSKSVMKESKKI